MRRPLLPVAPRERFSQPYLAFDHTGYQAGCDQLDRLKDYFLACVLAVFPVSTYLHAGREDCLLNNFEDAIMQPACCRSTPLRASSRTLPARPLSPIR